MPKHILILIWLGLGVSSYTRVWAQLPWPQVPSQYNLWQEMGRELPWRIGLAEAPQAVDYALASWQEPLDVNRATLTDLLALQLPLKQAQGIIQYRAQYGGFQSLYELVAVPELDSATSNQLMRLLTLAPLASQKMFGSKVTSALVQARTLINTRLLATEAQPLNMAIRSRIKLEHGWEVGLSTQQDAGEGFYFSPDRYWFGPDFWTGYAHGQWRLGTLRSITAGDFIISQGHGLVLGHGGQLNRGASAATSLMGYKQGIRPYHSLAEGGFLRGASAGFAIPLPRGQSLELLPYISHRMLDARFSQNTSLIGANDLTEEALLVSSLPESGLHRTPSEIDARARLSEQITGITTKLDLKDPNTGLQYGHLAWVSQLANYGAPVPWPRGSTAIQDSSRQLFNHALSGQYSIGPALFSGELAVSNRLHQDNAALSTEVLVAMGRQSVLAFRYRDYGKAYAAPYPAAYGRGAMPAAERGLSIGWQRMAKLGWAYSFWLDNWQWTTTRYRVSIPNSTGQELRADFSHHKENSSWQLRSRYRSQHQDISNTDGELGARLHAGQQELIYKPAWYLAITTSHSLGYTIASQGERLGQSIYRNTTYGLFSQHTASSHITTKLKAQASLLLFRNEGGNTRPFLQEPVPLWYQQVVAPSGQGFRLAGVISWKAIKDANGTLLTELKLAHVTGNNPQTEIMVQLTWQWERQVLEGLHLW